MDVGNKQMKIFFQAIHLVRNVKRCRCPIKSDSLSAIHSMSLSIMYPFITLIGMVVSKLSSLSIAP